MHKHLVALVVFFASVFLLVGCSSGSKTTTVQNKYADDAFYTALETGLQNRWKLNHKVKKDATESEYRSYINAELKQISKYRNKKFKSSKLQELAISYINALKANKALLPDYDNDSEKSISEWNNAYNKRCEVLNDLNAYKKIKVSKKYRHDLEDVLSTAKTAKEDEKISEAVKNLASTVQFKLVTDDDGYKTYQAIASNNTDYDFKTFQIDIKLIDTDGVTVETTTASTDNWTQDSKVRFEFETDNTFAKYEITPSYYEVK